MEPAVRQPETAAKKDRPPPRLHTFRALRNPDFRLFWFAGVGSMVGQGVQDFTRAWLVLEITGSVGQLGVVLFMQGLPMLALVLFGGVLADRIDRRKVMVACQAVTAVNVLALAGLVFGDLIQIWHVYLSALSAGIVQALYMPARQSFVRSLVRREDILNAVALNSMLMNTSRIVGPSAAGLLIGAFGIASTMVINAGFIVVAMACLLLIRQTGPSGPRSSSSMLRELTAGFQYVRTAPAMLSVVVLGLVWGVVGQSTVQLTPAFGKEVLELDATATGLLLMMGGVGAFLGNALLATVADVSRKNWWLIGAIHLFALGVAALALAPTFGTAALCMFAGGLGSMTFTSLGNALFQVHVPAQFLGRVTSMWQLGAGLMFAAALPIGLLGEVAGLRIAIGGAGLLFLVLVVYIGIALPHIRRLPERAPEQVGALSA